MGGKNIKRLLFVGIAVFLGGIFLMASASVTSQKKHAYQQMEQRLTALSSTIITSINNMMVTGNAMIVGDWMKGIKRTPGVEIIQVLRKDGVEAFSDDTAMHKVNEHLGVEMFTSRLEGLTTGEDRKHLFSSVPKKKLESVIKSQRAAFFREEIQGLPLLTMLAPIRSYERCKACHGYDPSPVRAIVRISIPTEEIELASKEAMKKEAYFGLAIGGIMLLLFIGYAFSMLKKLRAGQEEISMNAQVFAQARESIIITDIDGRIRSVNPAFTEVTGYREDEVIGQNPSILQSGQHDKDFYRDMWKLIESEGRWIGEIYNKRKNGEIYPEQLSISAIKDRHGNTVRYSGIFIDITERKQQEEKIAYMAYHDNLTGLPNRRTFQSLMDLEFAHAKRNGYGAAIMFLDLDGFKQVNDTKGHDVGDALLVKVSEMLSEAIREGDTVARMGGDEFTILLPQIQEMSSVATLGKKIVSLFKEGVEVNGERLNVGTSIGIAVYPSHGEDPEELLRKADEAMYKVKQSGKNNYQIYSEN